MNWQAVEATGVGPIFRTSSPACRHLGRGEEWRPPVKSKREDGFRKEKSRHGSRTIGSPRAWVGWGIRLSFFVPCRNSARKLDFSPPQMPTPLPVLAHMPCSRKSNPSRPFTLQLVFAGHQFTPIDSYDTHHGGNTSKYSFGMSKSTTSHSPKTRPREHSTDRKVSIARLEWRPKRTWSHLVVQKSTDL